jgi:hypothetical protein
LAAGQDGVRCRSSVGQDGARWWRSVLVRDWRGERQGQGRMVTRFHAGRWLQWARKPWEGLRGDFSWPTQPS